MDSEEENEYYDKAENCLETTKEIIEEKYEIVKDRAFEECENSTNPVKLEETVNLGLAMVLNVVVLLSVKEIGVLPHFLFVLYIPLSLLATYLFMGNKKIFEVFDFEELYFSLNHMSGQSRSVLLTDQKDNNQKKYYERILRFFRLKYPFISFKFITRKKQDSEHFLATRSIF